MLFSKIKSFINNLKYNPKVKIDLTQRNPIDINAVYLTLISTLLFLSIKLFGATQIESLKSELDTNPENLTLRHNLAKAYFDNGNYDLTIQTLKVKAEKLTQESLALLSISYNKIDDPINELKFLEQLTANYPKFPNGFVMLGDYYLKKSLQKNDPKLNLNALSSYKNAIEINPNHRPAYDGLLFAYEKYKNFYELRVLLDDMMKRFGKSSKLLSNLCRRYAVDGYFVNARKTCNEAINSDNKNPENYIYLSLVENNEGKTEKADLILKRVTSDFPESEEAASNYADFLIQQKNLPAAENYFQKAQKGDPNSFRASIGLAEVGFELKHYDSALSSYKNACKINPHQTIKHLKRAADLLRHRRESHIEEQYINAITKCNNFKENDRAPASLYIKKEEYRSAFALYSKNKNINLSNQ